MATIDPAELAKWKLKQTEPHWCAIYWGDLWHNRLPAWLGWKLSLGGIFFGSLRAMFMLVLALWPVWIKFYDMTSTLSWTEAAALSAVMAVMLGYNLWGLSQRTPVRTDNRVRN